MIVVGYSRAPSGIAQLGTPITAQYSSNVASQTTSLAGFGLQQNDVLMAAIACDGDGYDDLATTNTGIVDILARGGDAVGPSRQVSYIICGPTPPTDFVVTTNVVARRAAIILRAFRGVDTASVLDGAVPARNSGTGTAVDPPSQTTAAAGSWRHILGFIDDLNDLGYTHPAFTGLVESATTSSGDSTSATVVWAIQENTAIGALNPLAFAGVTPATEWSAVTLGMKAA